MANHLAIGRSLKGQALEVIIEERRLQDEVLNSRAPPVADILAALLRYYQLKFRYLVLLGKPTDGAVVSTWMAQVKFDDDTAMGKYRAYQRMRQLATQKKDMSPETFLEELARQANLTTAGQTWWTRVEARLTQSEDMQVAMMQPWVLTYQAISSAVE